MMKNRTVKSINLTPDQFLQFFNEIMREYPAAVLVYVSDSVSFVI
jgi:hypothetical protein